MASTPTGMNRFYLLLGGLAVAGGAVLFYLTRHQTPTVPVAVTVQASDTVGFHGYTLGSDSAKIEVTEYADFQCPACQLFATMQFPTIRQQLIETGRVRWRYRDFPIDQAHPFARLAALSALCAGDQGKFWEMATKLYDEHGTWAAESNGGERFRDYAQAVGVQMKDYDACVTGIKYAGRIQASADEGVRVGVGSTPSFIIDGHLYTGALSSDHFIRLIDSVEQSKVAPK